MIQPGRRVLGVVLLLAAHLCAAEKELKHDDGNRAGKKSSAGTGHAVTFQAPKGKWWVKSVLVHGARYGGNYDPKKTFFTVSVCDAGLKTLGSVEAPYDRFGYGRFGWVEVELAEPVPAKGTLVVIAEFHPTATKGVFVGWAKPAASHSAYAVPGGKLREVKDQEWMIRVRLTNKKPRKSRKPKATAYMRDFDFLKKTASRRYPAFKKKNIDWDAVCAEWRPRFAACKADSDHIANVLRLLARLKDTHTGLIESKAPYRSLAFEGLFGGGLWIAVDRGRLVVRHSLRRDVAPGSLLKTIDGRPAAEAHEAVRKKVSAWHGWSSTHFLDARLSFQFFDFGDKKTLPCEFLAPSGETKRVDLGRWGPGGKAVSRVGVTMPKGVDFEAGAVSARMGDLGYLRVTGGMSDATRKAFDKAFDGLKGVKGILLDGRGMGGGGDRPAWAMTGRFGVPKPSGPWQFDGPVVMLLDERMVSSAETFTWAMAETGRAVTVGRPTGGATIIPQMFRAPSGLFRFRMGTHDRKTPVRKIQPEGIGWPPDVFVFYEPYLLARYEGDPIFGVGMVALKRLVKGDKRAAVTSELSWHFGCDPKELLEAMLAWELKAGPDPARLADIASRAKRAGLKDLEQRARQAR